MRILANLVLILVFVLCWVAAQAEPATALPTKAFKISVDAAMWKKWGFQYPVTYMFDITGLSLAAKVRCRDHPSQEWRALPRRTADELYNGIECVRFDFSGERAFVSVGFGAGSSIDLEFENVSAAQYAGTAKYYDNRKAAYTLSIDNWGRQATANPGAPWRGSSDDLSDNYQAALHVCRELHLPVSIAINSDMGGKDAMWASMQQELDLQDSSWEPAVHAQTHPGSAKAYSVRGYAAEILPCRDQILQRLHKIPFGQRVFEHILTSGYHDETLLNVDSAQFLFVRGYNGRDSPESIAYANWDGKRELYGVGGLEVKAYDRVFARRNPKGRFFASDVAELNAPFDSVYAAGGICYAMWHPDRYLNSVLYDERPGRDGVQGSTLVQHLRHVANQKDVWYVANGWLYCYHYVAENAAVSGQ